MFKTSLGQIKKPMPSNYLDPHKGATFSRYEADTLFLFFSFLGVGGGGAGGHNENFHIEKPWWTGENPPRTNLAPIRYVLRVQLPIHIKWIASSDRKDIRARPIHHINCKKGPIPTVHVDVTCYIMHQHILHLPPYTILSKTLVPIQVTHNPVQGLDHSCSVFFHDKLQVNRVTAYR